MFSVFDILKATGGKLIQGNKDRSFSSVSTDTRKIERAQLFIPIVGRKFDGHGFIAEALKKGASGTLTSKDLKAVPGDKIIIRVKDTGKAFQDISRFYRLKFNIPIIGVTGSSGKTTTKDMIFSILSQEKKTLRNEGNFNNEIGVPLTLLGLNRSHKAAVIEMAMQKAGEIDELARVVLPKVAVITNIGEAHMEFFRSKKRIAEVKAEMFGCLSKKDFAVMNADDVFFSLLKNKAKKAKIVSFGINKGASVKASDIIKNGRGLSFAINYRSNKFRVEFPLPGLHNVYNALAAAAACLCVGIKPRSIQKGLKKFSPPSKRMEIIETDRVRLIIDCYNANPSSMKAAISVLSEEGPVTGKAKPRRIAVLGDMLELGHISKRSHQEVGKFSAQKGIDILVTKGHLSKDTALSARKAGIKKVYSTRSNEEASKLLKKLIKPNDVLLIKGSRGMKMEEIAENILR